MIQDGKMYEDLFIESTLRGNVFLAIGWFPDKRTTEMHAMMQKVEQQHPYDISGPITAEGKTVERITISVDLPAARKSGITFDWQAEGGFIEQSYNQYLTAVDVVYDEPGTYTINIDDACLCASSSLFVRADQKRCCLTKNNN
jgi:hypothetical protein